MDCFLLGSHPYSLHPDRQDDLLGTSVFGPFLWCFEMNGFVWVERVDVVGVGLLGYGQCLGWDFALIKEFSMSYSSMTCKSTNGTYQVLKLHSLQDFEENTACLAKPMLENAHSN